jgi:hypothetical protein
VPRARLRRLKRLGDEAKPPEHPVLCVDSAAAVLARMAPDIVERRVQRQGSTVAVAEHSLECQPQPAAVPLAQLPHAGPVARFAQG